jgi:hypothetical protein
MAGNLILGKPPNKTPKSKLPAMMKTKGFQAHEPTSSPVGVSTTKDLNKMMAPMMANMVPNKKSAGKTNVLEGTTRWVYSSPNFRHNLEILLALPRHDPEGSNGPPYSSE